MDQSAYLVQALQQMQGGAAPQSTPQGPSLSQMADAVKKRQAWEAANPGQNYMAYGIEQMGQNIAGAPSALMKGAQNLAGLPGQVAGGLQGLAGKIPGF